MTGNFPSTEKGSLLGALLWVLILPLALLAIGVLLALPLPWKEQGILGVALIGLALLLNWASRTVTVTMALMVISIFSTLRYGYWRVTQTWQGVTSAGHLHQWDTVFVLL